MKFLVHHLLTASADSNPDKEALVCGDRRLSYGELDHLTDRLAHAMVESGVGRMDRVGIFLEKNQEQVLSIMAASKAGAVSVPINHLLFPQQVGHILEDCRPKAIVTSCARMESIRDVLERCTWVEVLITTDGRPPEIAGKRLLDLGQVVQDEQAKPHEVCISQDLAAILYTSGSTGRPKGVMLSHGNLLAGSRIVSAYLKIDSRERILSIVPFSFDYGLNQLLTGLEHGATVVLLSFRFPGDVVEVLHRERITGLAGVPSFWSLLAQPSSSLHRHEFPDLRYITNTGGAMPKTLLRSLRHALPTTEIYLMYGLTEAFRSTYLPPEELDARPGSMGRAIPDTEIYVINDEGGLCKPGEVGELVHRGPTVSMGYWGNPQATEQVLRPNPVLSEGLRETEKVCFSGDLVEMDDDGFLYFRGRRDATIKCAGFRISPNEIEEVLVSTGRIREAAAIGVPDEILGHVVVAIVVPHDHETIGAEELTSFCATKLPRYMIPRRVEIVSELPKTAHGKIDYQALRQREMLTANPADE